MFLLPLLMALAAAPEEASPLRIQPGEQPTAITVSAPLPAALADADEGNLRDDAAARFLWLSFLDEEGQPGPAMFGQYRREGDRLEFVPRYGLVPEATYLATFRLSENETITRRYVVPAAKSTPPPVLEKVYPTADLLPANHLKFYLHFSQPMREGKEIFEQLHLLDARGQEIPHPWRRTELWDDDARRFTLWIHPGRIKQGVNLRTELGPVLKPGEKYTLLIDADLLDAKGQPLGREIRKVFVAGAADHQRPLPQDWQLQSPPAGSREPLAVKFREAMDRALLLRMLHVLDDEGQQVTGQIEIGSGESSWHFQPAQPWGKRTYTLRVQQELEDLAGNTPQRVFDTDLDQAAGKEPVLELSFKPQ